MISRSYRETGRCASGYGGAICMYAAGNRHEQTKPGETDRAGATWPVPYRGERRNVRIRCRRHGVGALWGHIGLGIAGAPTLRRYFDFRRQGAVGENNKPKGKVKQ